MLFFWWPACSLQWSRWFSCFSSLMSGLVSVQLLLQTALVDLWLVLLEPCWWAFEVWLVLIGRLLPRPWWWWLWPFSGLLVKPLLEAGPPHGLSQVGGRPLHQLTCSPSRELSPAPKFSPAPREFSPACPTEFSRIVLENSPNHVKNSPCMFRPIIFQVLPKNSGHDLRSRILHLRPSVYLEGKCWK